MLKEGRHIILFDGVCNLCNRSVQFIIKKDKKGIFKFASLQSTVGKELLKEFELPEDSFQSFIYIKNDFSRSDAALEIAKMLNGVWQFVYFFKIVPKFFRDPIYNLIARNRYKWFGKKDECRVPTSKMKERFF